MKVFAKFDEIPSRTLQDIKETKRHGHTIVCSFVRSFLRSDGQRENSISSRKGYKNATCFISTVQFSNQVCTH